MFLLVGTRKQMRENKIDNFTTLQWHQH